MRHAGLLKSDKVLINGVDVNIELTRAPDVFLSFGPFRRQQITYQDFRRYSFNNSG
jgi:hypothetical protein